ncbi:hypothetical protein [Leisingera sp.]|uniref:hypothetical protein n=1 Tax=Leisingera sp. TaxID=1879318 RepID=UPI002B26B569|nr:hypothetical protein [Leisingera sp.]
MPLEREIAALEATGEQLVLDCSKELDQLERYANIGLAIAEMRFIVDRLDAMGPWPAGEIGIEVVNEITVLQTALSVVYGRLFVNGVIKLDHNDIPPELRSYHDKIIALRHERFAHHGGHESVEIGLEFEFDGAVLTVFQRANMKFVMGKLEGIDDLLSWLSAHMRERSAKVLMRMSDKSGVDWQLALPPGTI